MLATRADEVPMAAAPPEARTDDASSLWLQPWLVAVAKLVTGSYYRVTLTGATVPAEGAVLVVSNHPNMLFDALLATAAAGRPLRFVAKSTLFRIPVFGRVLQAIGALPVYRRRDAAVAGGNNDQALRAIIAALGAGDAVLIFPEGTSAEGGELLPFRSGPSRILLAARRRGIEPTVVAAGLHYAHRERPGARVAVRMQLLTPMRDLPARPDDPVTVRTLTERLERAVKALLAIGSPDRDTWRPHYRWGGVLRLARFVALRGPMWLSHRLVDRLPMARAERATQHLVLGLGLMAAVWALVGVTGLALGGWRWAVIGLVGFPLAMVGGAACTTRWAADQRP